MSEKTTQLLKLFGKETRSLGGADRALFCLLKQYEKDLPEVDDYFHKAFRQTDVTSNEYSDMAIWYLLAKSSVFWECFEQVRSK